MRREDKIRVRHMRNAATEAIGFVKGRERGELDADRQVLFGIRKRGKDPLWLVLSVVLTAVPVTAAAQTMPGRWTLDEEQRLGSVDGPGALTQVGSMAVSPDGRSILVAQPNERVVRIFDAGSARQTHVVGGEGNGPGEFVTMAAAGWRRDTLWVTDPQQARVTLFRRSGDLLRTYAVRGPLLPEISSRPTVATHVLDDGYVLGPAIGKLGAARLPLLTWHLETDQRAILAWLDNSRSVGVYRDGRQELMFMLPVPGQSLWAVDPDGSQLVVVHRPVARDAGRHRFQVIKMTAAGDTLFARNYGYPARVFPSEIRDSMESAFVDRVSGAAMSRSQAARLARDSLQIPVFEAPVSHVLLDRNGRVWLQRERYSRAEAEWLVLGPEGQIIASVAGPKGLELRYADNERVMGVLHDELDVPYVVIAKIRSHQ